jgi:16S rRNA (cytosine967-C5)-methyltransferase
MSTISDSFRKKHLLQLLEEYDLQDRPLDYFVSEYFKKNKALGSKDRAFINETVYKLIRWKGLCDYILQDEASWLKRFELVCEKEMTSYLHDESIPLHIRVSFPETLFKEIENSWGKESAVQICLASNLAAPTAIRVNTLKISRDELLAKWKEKDFEVSAATFSPAGIIFHKKIHFFSLPEFRDGLFEVQDEASQMIALLLSAKPGDLVLDFCAGAGGKTLAFAEKLGGKGQIFLHDIRLHALYEARKRLKRAGIQNSQIVHSEDQAKLKKLKKRMNAIFVDAPCTGTGTLRRNPDMKWKFSEESLQRLVSQQRVIFEQALSYLHPEGEIIYATCSILKRENQDQLAHFLKTYSLEVVGEIFQSVPMAGEKDGFFAVRLRRKQDETKKITR